jgi:membrane-associated phospholipid phosphatase
MKLNELQIISIIILISIYHYYVQNDLEKNFFRCYIDYNSIKRPLATCNKFKNSPRLICVGMPSGHAETITILSSLLYLYKFIPLWLCLLLIFIFSIQRVIINMHTLIQIIFGIIFGLFYVFIYKYFNLSVYAFLIVFSIGILLYNICKISN